MSEYLDWKVGDRVICVDDEESTSEVHAGLKIGEIYLILETKMFSSTLHIRIRNEEGFYYVYRFRKLVLRKTDISIFEKMLTKTPEQNNKELVESEREELVNV